MFSVFVEQIRHPKRFLALAAEARRRGKPIVLMHPGRSARSREAAKSHTGALAGDHAVMRAFVAAEAVVLVESLDELFDTSRLLARYPHPPAGGAGIMSNSGAIRGFALDFCEHIDLPLPELAAATCAALKQVLPDFATIDNPLDITAQGMQKPSLFGDSAAALLRDPIGRRSAGGRHGRLADAADGEMEFAQAGAGRLRRSRYRWPIWAMPGRCPTNFLAEHQK